MKFRIKTEVCRGCGICEVICPSVFKMEDNMAKVVAVNVPKDMVQCALHGESVCPVKAITHE